MNIDEYIDVMKQLQIKFLTFIEDENDNEENFHNLVNLITDVHLEKNVHVIKSFLYLISKIANNHYRGPNFISKIEQVLLQMQNFASFFT